MRGLVSYLFSFNMDQVFYVGLFLIGYIGESRRKTSCSCRNTTQILGDSRYLGSFLDRQGEALRLLGRCQFSALVKSPFCFYCTLAVKGYEIFVTCGD